MAIIIELLILCLILYSCDSIINKKFIFDEESGQSFPLSQASLDMDLAIFPLVSNHSLVMMQFDLNRTMPGYVELFTQTWLFLKEMIFSTKCRSSPSLTLRLIYSIRLLQLFFVFIVCTSMLLLRYTLHFLLVNTLAVNCGITNSIALKVVESGCRGFWHLVLWLISLKIVIFSGHSYFYYPFELLKYYKLEVGFFDVPLPLPYYIAYILQLGYYLYSLWCLFFMDVWRKDSFALLIHHGLTLFLLQLSFMMRLHRFGLLVVFLHDLNDVLLEIAKINLYLRIRFGRIYLINMKLANIFFIFFLLSWMLTRLYWFPLKVLYATSWGVYLVFDGRECIAIVLFNVMLWALFFLHLYWFMFILRMAVRLITNPIELCNDIREDSLTKLELEEVSKNCINFKENGNAKYFKKDE